MRPLTYDISFSGPAGRTLRAQFDDCEVITSPETTTLRAELPDQAALPGLVERVVGLGLEIIDVHLVTQPAGLAEGYDGRLTGRVLRGRGRDTCSWCGFGGWEHEGRGQADQADERQHDHGDAVGPGGLGQGSPGLIQPWIAQLRKITEEMADMTGLGESVFARPAPSLPSVPLPGAISASQLNAIASALAAQRSSIAALKAQLIAFDDQLEALEGILGPLAEWSKKWAEFERLVTKPGSDPRPNG